jgi:hypothetical protein
MDNNRWKWSEKCGESGEDFVEAFWATVLSLRLTSICYQLLAYGLFSGFVHMVIMLFFIFHVFSLISILIVLLCQVVSDSVASWQKQIQVNCMHRCIWLFFLEDHYKSNFLHYRIKWRTSDGNKFQWKSPLKQFTLRVWWWIHSLFQCNIQHGIKNGTLTWSCWLTGSGMTA